VGPNLTVENWREVVGSKIENISFEQALDDVRPFISPQEDLIPLTKDNLLRLLRVS
jgi:hypothetical protein